MTHDQKIILWLAAAALASLTMNIWFSPWLV
jgi:hypothetical protein